MGKATSIILGDHFDAMINEQVKAGRYATASEVVRDALRLFEQQQSAIARLNSAIEEGFASGLADGVDWNKLDAIAEGAQSSPR